VPLFVRRTLQTGISQSDHVSRIADGDKKSYVTGCKEKSLKQLTIVHHISAMQRHVRQLSFMLEPEICYNQYASILLMITT
jgi:hypothetical protein